MSRDPREKAKRYGLEPPAVEILLCVTGWFSGRSFPFQNQQKRIGTDFEPTLRQLCSSLDLWGDQHPDVHKSLQDRGVFKSEDNGDNIYCAGRRCKWLPTNNAMSIIEDIFADEKGVYAPWATDEHSNPPTYRDGSELMIHRKGVLAASKTFQQLEDFIHSDIYPVVNLPQRPDIRLYGRPAGALAQVEVLTSHNDRDAWESKFKAWGGDTVPPTVWVFENRIWMVRFVNHFVRQKWIELDNGLFGGNPSNWSPKRVNDRLRRSREGRQGYHSHDVVTTIPSLLEADPVQTHEFVEENNII